MKDIVLDREALYKALKDYLEYQKETEGPEVSKVYWKYQGKIDLIKQLLNLK